MIMPFIEQTTGFNAMNFLIPLYDLNGDDMPQNTTVYSMQVKAFLCPTDVRDGIEIEFEMPCNYAANSGNGLPGGFSLPASYGTPNGPFYSNSGTTMANVIDGSSNTAAFGESIIGTNSNVPRRRARRTPRRSWSNCPRASTRSPIRSLTSPWSRPIASPRRTTAGTARRTGSTRTTGTRSTITT